MTIEAQKRVALIAVIAEALLVGVIIPLAIYLIKSTIELKTEIAQLKVGIITREEFIDKGDMIRKEAIELRAELAKLRNEIERKNP